METFSTPQSLPIILNRKTHNISKLKDVSTLHSKLVGVGSFSPQHIRIVGISGSSAFLGDRRPIRLIYNGILEIFSHKYHIQSPIQTQSISHIKDDVNVIQRRRREMLHTLERHSHKIY